jgi:hypothetical protein
MGMIFARAMGAGRGDGVISRKRPEMAEFVDSGNAVAV